MTQQTTIFQAKHIITMHPSNPFANAVAVRDGRILGVGDLQDLVHWVKQSPFLPCDVDTTLKDKVLLPGFVDAHTHVDVQALLYKGSFISPYEWPRPEGGMYPVCATKADVVRRLKEIDGKLPPGELLFGVAYDENKMGSGFHCSELDAISKDRPIVLSNSVFHRFWCNSIVLERAGISEANAPAGVVTDADGKPNGTLLEHTGLSHIVPSFPELIQLGEPEIRAILPLFAAGGVTTLYDAGFAALTNLDINHGIYQNILSDDAVRLRVSCGAFVNTALKQLDSIDALIAKVDVLKAADSDKLRMGPVKLYADGSIISHTADVGWPGYWDGAPQGSWECGPERIRELLVRFHEAGWSTVTHTNGRPAIQAVLDAVKAAQIRNYRPEMRHRVDHCYNITEAQLRQARELGVGVQFFTTQIYYYGDSHLKVQGPDRAHRMTPAGSAKRIGVSWGIHVDPPGTPQLPLTAAWATVNRLTEETGTILGPQERVSVEDALRALTIEHAYQLHLEHEVGSIEFGKKADFCVLEADPLAVDPLELKDIPVWGTVFAGELNPI